MSRLAVIHMWNIKNSPSPTGSSKKKFVPQAPTLQNCYFCIPNLALISASIIMHSNSPVSFSLLTAAPRKGCICACMRECDRGVDPPLPCDQPAATPWPAQAGPLVLAPLEELPPPALLLLAVGARHLVRLAHDRLRVCHAHCLDWLVGHLSSVSVGQTS